MDAISREISRRNLFRFLGNSVIFLPFMRTLLETQAFGEVTKKRALFYFYPSGYVPGSFIPENAGTDFVLPTSTKPLNSVRSDIVMFKGLSYDTKGSSESRHGSGNQYSLTGSAVDITNVSIDTYLGQKLSASSLYPVLRLGVARSTSAGRNLHNAISFNQAGAPGRNPAISQFEDNPVIVFNKMFAGSTSPDPSKTTPIGLTPALKGSLLDANLDQLKLLQTKLGATEKAKLDYHVASVRELERRLQLSGMMNGNVTTQCKKGLSQNVSFSEEDTFNPDRFNVIADLQREVAIQALACGVTNVVVISMSHGTSRLPLTKGLPAAGGRGHHESSHYARSPSPNLHIENQAYMMDKLAKIISGMRDIKEGDKSLLFNSAVMAFSELGDGDRHSHDDMGVILAGQAGGYFKTGQCIQINEAKYKHNNVLVSILNGMGLPDKTFGNRDNGNGVIRELVTA